MLDEIFGYVEHITFYSPDNGFTVARLKEPKKRDLTCIVGNLSSIQPGETIRCKGDWKNDPKFGLQFQVKTYQVESPATVAGIKKYLGSGLIKGIGPVYAARIVKLFSDKTLDIIDESPEKLFEVPGIGDKRVTQIKKCWQEQKVIRHIMIFLQSYQINPSLGLSRGICKIVPL